MNKSKALKRVQSVFSSYKRLHPPDQLWLNNLQSGKLYELYCLAEVLEKLVRDYGYMVHFVGSSIKFKMSPGLIKASDPHFDLADHTGAIVYRIYTDIEFLTLGVSMSSAVGPSTYHELDIAVVDAGVTGRPQHDEVVLAVECKSHAAFKKSIVREALGLRRELSLLRPASPSRLSMTAPSRPNAPVPADPPSEHWLAFLAPNGTGYDASPRVFGIQFNHWQP